MTTKPTFIDLFAGAGGLSEGFIRAGFEPIAHVEMDKAACNTLKTRTAYFYLKENKRFSEYEDYLKGNITRDELYFKVKDNSLDSVINKPIGPENNPEIFKKIDEKLGQRKVDLIIGGPPCQAYSLVGRARSSDGMKSDERNFLFVQYAEYLDRYQPRLFVFENVLGLKSANKGFYLDSMKELFKEKGYETNLFTLNARNFGVLQNRKRIIIIGKRIDVSSQVPDLNSIKSENRYLLKDILSDLPELKDGQGTFKNGSYAGNLSEYLKKTHIRNGISVLTQHVSRPHSSLDKEIYKIAVEKWEKENERINYNDLPEHLKTHKNRTSFFDRFKIVAADLEYAQTVVAHIAKDGHYYIHPDKNQNRSISVREAARIQSFPDDYFFEGENENSPRTAAFKQIGNAVPPLMAEKIAKSIKILI